MGAMIVCWLSGCTVAVLELHSIAEPFQIVSYHEGCSLEHQYEEELAMVHHIIRRSAPATTLSDDDNLPISVIVAEFVLSLALPSMIGCIGSYLGKPVQ